MKYIDLNSDINYKYASMRIFNKGEKHVNRICPDNVLVIVFEGVLRFTEDYKDYEIHKGEYFIQRKGSLQADNKISDEPKYLYVHFNADFVEKGEKLLPISGVYDYERLLPLCRKLDKYVHEDRIKTEVLSVFYEMLSALYKKERTENERAKEIRKYIEANYLDNITLENIGKTFSFSKNHVINIFKNEYGVTPFEYINMLKIKKCEYLLEVTGESIENIAINCGFNNYSQFYRLFLRKNNMSPKEYRIFKSYR